MQVPDTKPDMGIVRHLFCNTGVVLCGLIIPAECCTDITAKCQKVRALRRILQCKCHSICRLIISAKGRAQLCHLGSNTRNLRILTQNSQICFYCCLGIAAFRLDPCKRNQHAWMTGQKLFCRNKRLTSFSIFSKHLTTLCNTDMCRRCCRRQRNSTLIVGKCISIFSVAEQNSCQTKDQREIIRHRLQQMGICCCC